MFQDILKKDQNRYLTSPVTTPVDRIVATAEQLTTAVADISKEDELKEMKDSKAFTEFFRKVAAQNNEKTYGLKI